MILAAEEQRHRPVARGAEQAGRGVTRIEARAFGRAAARGEPGNADTPRQRGVQRVVFLNAPDDLPGIVRDDLDPIALVRHRTDEAQIRDAHVLHCAHHGRDVDGVLRLVQHDANGSKK